LCGVGLILFGSGLFRGSRLLGGFSLGDRGQDHQQAAALHIRADFHLTDIGKTFGEVIQNPQGHLGVLNFTSAKTQSNLDFCAAFQEFPGLAYADICVMFARLGTQTNFLDFDLLLRFSRLTLPLGLFVLIFAVIDQTADRGLGCRSDFNQIEITLSGKTQGFRWRHDAQLRAILVDDTDLRCSDLLVDSGARRATHIPSVATFPLGYVAFLLSLLR